MDKKSHLKSQLKQAIDAVSEQFPFPNYVTPSAFYGMYPLVRELEKFIPDFQGKRLLDVGSGPMNKTGILQEMGFQCHSVDDLGDPWHQRDDNIQKIKQYAESIGINFQHQEAGDHSIAAKPGSFDVVCCLAVIEHLHESPRGILNAMGIHARPGGLILVSMPNSVNLRKRLSVALGRTNYPPVDMFYKSIGTWRGHVREYTLRETAYICKTAGFEILSQTTYEHLAYEKLTFPLRNVYVWLGNLLPTLRSSLLVLCRKPEDWTPAEEDPEAFRASMARSTPKGVN